MSNILISLLWPNFFVFLSVFLSYFLSYYFNFLLVHFFIVRLSILCFDLYYLLLLLPLSLSLSLSLFLSWPFIQHTSFPFHFLVFFCTHFSPVLSPFCTFRTFPGLASISFLHPAEDTPSSAQFVTGTGHKHIRLYDVKASQQPSFSIDILGEYRVTSIQPTVDGNALFVGDCSGTLLC